MHDKHMQTDEDWGALRGVKAVFGVSCGGHAPLKERCQAVGGQKFTTPGLV